MRFSSVLFPALVYPTMAATGTERRCRRLRRNARFLLRFFNCRSREVSRSCARRRLISNLVSPGPRPPIPPVRRDIAVGMSANRGIRYRSCASSTWSFPSRDVARWAKISKMSCVRSSTFRSVAVAMFRSWDGESSRSKASASTCKCMLRTSNS